jgi:hypothetical protein
MDIFQNVFLDTTDPRTKYTRLMAIDVGFCIVINIALYAVFYYILIHVFRLPNRMTLLVGCLIVIMTLGYIGRLSRSKSVFRVYLERGDSHEDAYWKTVKDIRRAYFTWYFMG